MASATVREATTGVMAVTIGGRMGAMRDAISALRARKVNRRRRVNNNPGAVNTVAEAASAATVIVTAALASAKDSRHASRANLASRVQPSRRASRVRRANRANRASRVRRHRERIRPLPQSRQLQVRYAKARPAHRVATAKGAVVAIVAGAVIAASRAWNERPSKAPRQRKSQTR